MSDNWICWSLFLDELGEFFLKPSQITCGDVGLTFFFKVFSPWDNYFLQFSSCDPWRVFSHSNSPSHRALGRYRHMSSSRQLHNILCWLEILNYCPDGGNGNFHCSSSFLKVTSLICEAQLSFAAHQKYILCFFSLWWMIKGIWALFSLLFIFLWNRKPWLDNFMFIITLECSKLWIWMRIYFRDILLIRISRGTNNCVQRVFEKNIYFIRIFPPFKILINQWKVRFLWILK